MAHAMETTIEKPRAGGPALAAGVQTAAEEAVGENIERPKVDQGSTPSQTSPVDTNPEKTESNLNGIHQSTENQANTQTQSKEQAKGPLGAILELLTRDDIQNVSVALAVVANLIGNGYNIFAEVTNASPRIKKTAYEVAGVGTKVAKSVIRMFNALKQFSAKNYIVAACLASEILNIFVPQELIYPFTGIPYGVMLTAIAANRGMDRGTKGKEYKSFWDCLSAYPKGIMNSVKDAGGIKKAVTNFFNADSGMLSLFNGIIISLGGLDAIFGNFSRGIWFRSAFSMLQSFDRMKSFKKQPWHFGAGVTHTSSGLFGIVRGVVKGNEKLERIFESVNMIFDILGNVCMKMTIDTKEVLRTVMAENNMFIQIYNFFAKTFGFERITDESLAKATTRPNLEHRLEKIRKNTLKHRMEEQIDMSRAPDSLPEEVGTDENIAAAKVKEEELMRKLAGST